MNQLRGHRIAVLVALLLLAARGSGRIARSPDHAEVRSVVFAALRHAIVETKDLADLQLVESSPDIIVRADLLSPSLLLTADDIPPIANGRFLLMTSNQIMRRATKLGDIYYVGADHVEISHDLATLWIGVHVIQPPNSQGQLLCCCTDKVQFVRKTAGWMFRKRLTSVCS